MKKLHKNRAVHIIKRDFNVKRMCSLAMICFPSSSLLTCINLSFNRTEKKKRPSLKSRVERQTNGAPRQPEILDAENSNDVTNIGSSFLNKKKTSKYFFPWPSASRLVRQTRSQTKRAKVRNSKNEDIPPHINIYKDPIGSAQKTRLYRRKKAEIYEILFASPHFDNHTILATDKLYKVAIRKSMS